MQNILPEQRLDILVEKGAVDTVNLLSSLAAIRRRPTINMKRITISILCLSVVAVSAFAEDNSTPADNSGRNTTRSLRRDPNLWRSIK